MRRRGTPLLGVRLAPGRRRGRGGHPAVTVTGFNDSVTRDSVLPPVSAPAATSLGPGLARLAAQSP